MSQNAKNLGLIAIFLGCIFVFNVVVWMSWNSSFILNDGIQYLSTATNWLEGRGFSTNALMYTPHFQGTLPAPQTVWPPGYPLIIALTSMLGMSLQSASLLINLISLAVSALLVYVILVRYKLSYSAAFVCALIFYCTAMPWSYSVALITEPIFSLLILAAIYFQPNDVRGKIGPWVISGIFIALCVFTHYSGVIFAVGVGLGMFAYLIVSYHTEPRLLLRGIALLTLQISISVALFLAMLYRTYLLTGTISRSIGVVETEHSWLARLKITVWQVNEYLGFTEAGFLSSPASNLLFGLVLLLLVIILAQVLFVTIKALRRALPTDTLSNDVMRYVIVGHSFVFVVFFGLHIVGISIVELSHRYLHQIYPGVFILICILVANCFEKMKLLHLTGPSFWFRRSLGVLLCLFLIGQANSATATKYHASAGRQLQEVVALKVSANIDLQAMIQSCFKRSGSTVGSIWSNGGQQLHQATGVPTITIADVYGNKPYEMENVRAQIADYDIKMFVFLNNLPDIAPDYVRMLSNVKQFLELSGYTKVPMLENRISDNITIDTYAVDQACLNLE